MKAPNPIALTAAVLFTTIGLAALSPSIPKQPVTEINGMKVTTLPTVEVHPTPGDQRAAALLTTASLTIAALPLTKGTESGAALLGAQLAMPYYSFGSPKFTGISKE